MKLLCVRSSHVMISRCSNQLGAGLRTVFACHLRAICVLMSLQVVTPAAAVLLVCTANPVQRCTCSLFCTFTVCLESLFVLLLHAGGLLDPCPIVARAVLQASTLYANGRMCVFRTCAVAIMCRLQILAGDSFSLRLFPVQAVVAA